jgi:hypothetical protein
MNFKIVVYLRWLKKADGTLVLQYKTSDWFDVPVVLEKLPVEKEPERV